EAVGYAALLSGILILIIGIIDSAAYRRRHQALERLKSIVTALDIDQELPAPLDQIEQDYQELIQIINQSRSGIINEADRIHHDLVDYYTIWVHQIKTPIAAMRLLLQSEPTETRAELLDQLFRIEQYVEMVLQYLRMESMNADLLISRYDLDEIVRSAIRKYSQTFIHKKIKLDYQELHCEVLTDAKWLTFVIEQLLSNALKYTPAGGTITIYMEPHAPGVTPAPPDALATSAATPETLATPAATATLVIADTGIGIEPEDIPRVFERGFTGYNGRLDRKASGIGLSLCRRILDQLSHTITLESTVGKGTKVKIGLEETEIAGD
ncbi:MAG TPA: hypothetical protein DCL69_11325, partial [Firmicutes bacterium]|nr:hypothetical protein [Bacillota bacterium]